MNWYYAVGNEKIGPVGEEEFQRLVRQGVVTPDTLVWRDGMAGWKRHGGVPPALSVQPSGPTTVCASCGRSVPADETILLDDKVCCAACKPQMLARIREGLPVSSPGAEEMRNRYLKHEASVRSVGSLYYLGGGLLILAALGSVLGASSGGDTAVSAIVGVILLVLGAAQIWTAYGLRRLQSWARVPVGIMSGLGLLGFPLGTLINGYILYLIFSQKGVVVFSPEYRAVIAQTPHIKYRMSALVWILVGIVVLVLVAALFAVIAGSS